MNSKLLSLVLILALFAPFGQSHSASVAQAAPNQTVSYAVNSSGYPYEVTLLSPTGCLSHGFDINELGQIVGDSCTISGFSHATLWANNIITDMGTLGGTRSHAYGINDAGLAVGMSLNSGNFGRAFQWQSGSPMQLLNISGVNDTAMAVNNAGLVVGYAADANNVPKAVKWTSGSVSDLQIGNNSEALDVSNIGHIVGRFGQAAFMLFNGVMTPSLGNFGGTSSGARAVNDLGQVVGWSTTSDNVRHAFLWQNGTIQNLDPGNNVNTEAIDINEAGQVVGYHESFGAFLWENGQMKDLDTLIDPGSGWSFSNAYGINNRGEIVGWGIKTPSSTSQAFKLTPIFTVTDLTSTPGTAADAATLSWTAPDVGGSSASAYDIRYSNLPIDDTTWVTAAQLTGEPFPALPGSTETFTVPSLTNGTRWYFALKYQLFGNWSSLSNVPSLLDAGFRPPSNGYNFPNFTDSQDSDLTFQDMITLFNSQAAVCWNPIGACIPRPAAEQWRQNAINGTSGGHCEGMSLSSLRFFKGLENPASFQTGATVTHDLAKLNARGNITRYFVPQLQNPLQAYKTQQLLKTPSQNLNELMTALSGSVPVPMNMIVRQAGGHAITPFAVEERSNDWRVWVYNNNTPEISSTVFITTTLQSWSYAMGGSLGTWSGNPGNQSLTRGLGVIPISQSTLPLDCPWCIFPPLPSPQSTAAAANGEVWLAGAGHLLISDSQNRQLGYEGTQFVSEIPGAEAGPIDGGLGELEPIYSVPLTDTYTLQLDGQTLSQPGTANLVQFGPGYASGAKNISIDPNTLDQLVIAADGSQVEYQPSHNKALELLLAVEESATQGYTFQLKGVDLASGQPVSASVEFATGRLLLDNLAGVDGTYDLDVRRSNATGQWSFFHPGITLLATDKHYLDFANWDGAGDMTLLIDHGGEGTIDETLPLTNTQFRGYLPLMIKN